MQEALNFLIGREMRVKGRVERNILQAGNIEGTYYWDNLRFTSGDVESIMIHETGIVTLTLKVLK